MISNSNERFEAKKRIEECNTNIIRLASELAKIEVIEIQTNAQKSIKAALQPVLPEHKCSDCLFFKIEGIPEKEHQFKNIDLYLTINFNHAKEEFLDKYITFGIKAGELKIYPDNCFLPFQNRRFRNPFLISIDGSTYWEVTNIGDEEEQPGWRFETTDETETTLKVGGIIQEQWAKIQIINKPFHIKAIFKVFKEDIVLVKSNFLPDNIDENKRTLIKNKIISYLYQKYFNSYVSKVELNHD